MLFKLPFSGLEVSVVQLARTLSVLVGYSVGMSLNLSQRLLAVNDLARPHGVARQRAARADPNVSTSTMKFVAAGLSFSCPEGRCVEVA